MQRRTPGKRQRESALECSSGAIASTGSQRYTIDLEEDFDARRKPPTGRRSFGVTSTAGRSRGRTSTVRRTATTRKDDVYIVALIENRAKEVGIAAYNLRSFHVELRQYSDTNCFVNTMTLLAIFSPVEIVLSQSSTGGALDRAIQDNPFLTDVRCSFIGRKYFNETHGILICEKLSAELCPNLAVSSTIPRYLALACCSALIKYVEHIQAVVFEPGSMRVTLSQNDGTLFIDIATIDAVELIRSSRPSMDVFSGKSIAGRKDSLLGVVDRTKTRPGKRFLRRTLLEPPSDLETIAARQDLVQEMSEDESRYFAICEALSTFPDLEAVLASLLAKEAALSSQYAPPPPRRTSQENEKARTPVSARTDIPLEMGEQERWTAGKTLKSGVVETMSPPSISLVRRVLQVKAALDAVPNILEIAERGSTSIILAVAETLRAKPLSDLSRHIKELLDDDAAPSRNTEHMRLQGAFAIRTGKNGHLDVARKTLSENIEDMHKDLNQLRERLDNPKINLSMNARRGYHFSAPSASMNATKLDDSFVQVQSTGKLLRFSTNNLVELNARVKESLAEVWTMTDRELGELMDTLWAPETVRSLHRLCDSIAILDAVTSLVSYCSLSPVVTTRPKITKGGPIELRNAHHPILGERMSDESIPNDVFLSETSALHVITGRNNSGKSTFMRSVALQAILAHTGCSVPAEFASVRLLQNIATRFDTSDDITASQSHHSKEMQEMGAILRIINKPNKENAHPFSLILIDELGRSTSATDGFSIAYAVAEKLAFTPNVLTLFATHFAAIGALRYTCPVVKSFHLAAAQGNALMPNMSTAMPSEQPSLVNDSECGPVVSFTYKVVDGVNPDIYYGIEAARNAGLPATLISKAIAVRAALPLQRMSSEEEFRRTHLLSEENTRTTQRRERNAVQIVEKLVRLRMSTADGDEDSLRAKLVSLQNRIRAANAKARARTQ